MFKLCTFVHYAVLAHNVINLHRITTNLQEVRPPSPHTYPHILGAKLYSVTVQAALYDFFGPKILKAPTIKER